MDLKIKLDKLKALDGLALYKWTARRSRIADSFILLSDLRLNTLTCDKGQVVFSSAAPVLLSKHGRPHIRFIDHDVLHVTDGRRKGINIAGSQLHFDEEASPAGFCGSFVIDSPEQLPWIKKRVMSMGCSLVYPSGRLVVPELFRISRDPDAFKPLFTRGLIELLGGTKNTPVPVLQELFRQHIKRVAAITGNGWVISNDYVSRGGCCVVSSSGITPRGGSCVQEMPLAAYRRELLLRDWDINTGDCDELPGTCD